MAQHPTCGVRVVEREGVGGEVGFKLSQRSNEILLLLTPDTLNTLTPKLLYVTKTGMNMYNEDLGGKLC